MENEHNNLTQKILLENVLPIHLNFRYKIFLYLAVPVLKEKPVSNKRSSGPLEFPYK
jgi:hypothetical protein